MKQVIILEALKPRELKKSSNKSFSIKGAVALLTSHLLHFGISAGITAFISVCLSMNMLAAVASFLCLVCIWLHDEFIAKGGEK